MKHLAQYLVPSKWEEEGTWRDAGNPEGSLALSVAYSEAKGQLSEKRRLERSQPGVDEGSSTCAGMCIAVSGLSVGSWAHRIPRSQA